LLAGAAETRERKATGSAEITQSAFWSGSATVSASRAQPAIWPPLA
jgi:hypothetical protein